MMIFVRVKFFEIAFYSGIHILASFVDLKPVEDFTNEAINDLATSNDLSRNRKIIYYCFLFELSRNHHLKEKYKLELIQLLIEFKNIFLNSFLFPCLA